MYHAHITTCVDVDLCQRNKIGDGMCQAVNNNAKCEFDGGDCCTGEDPSCIFCYGQFCLCHETGEYHCTGSIYKTGRSLKYDTSST